MSRISERVAVLSGNLEVTAMPGMSAPRAYFDKRAKKLSNTSTEGAGKSGLKPGEPVATSKGMPHDISSVTEAMRHAGRHATSKSHMHRMMATYHRRAENMHTKALKDIGKGKMDGSKEEDHQIMQEYHGMNANHHEDMSVFFKGRRKLGA